MGKQARVLITDKAHTALSEGLQALGYAVDEHPDIRPEEVRERLSAYEGVVINSKVRMDRAMMDAGVRLRFIARLGSGLDVIDLPYATEKGIACINSPEGNRDAVAEHACGMLLSLLHKLHKAHMELKELKWEREANRGLELGARTVGIIGYGNTGSAFAHRLSSFGCKVLVYDKYQKNFGNSNIKEVYLQELFENCDVLSLHLPLTDETEFMVDESFLDKFKSEIILLNTSRGKIVKQDDLLASLKTGKVFAAGLDVFENEQIAGWSKAYRQQMLELASMDNVIMTPHVAGWTVESKRRIADTLVDKIAALVRS